VQNLLNTRCKETQFATESRLRGEVVPVEEMHFTPGTLFFTHLLPLINKRGVYLNNKIF